MYSVSLNNVHKRGINTIISFHFYAFFHMRVACIGVTSFMARQLEMKICNAENPF